MNNEIIERAFLAGAENKYLCFAHTQYINGELCLRLYFSDNIDKPVNDLAFTIKLLECYSRVRPNSEKR